MSGAVQPGYAPPTGPEQPAGGRRWRRALIAATVAWAVLLGVLTWVSVRDDGPTVREQRTLSQAGPVVDRAIGELVAAAGADAVPELTPPRVERGCRVTPFQDGATLERDVVLRVAGDRVGAVLDRIAERLPTRWRAGVGVTRDGVRLRADAGEFVTVEGGPTRDGTIRLTADTGCRPPGDGYPVPPTAGADAEAAAVADVLRAFGRPATGAPELSFAPCPDGTRTARTARATAGPGAAPPALAAVLAPLAAGAVVLDTPEVYAYRSGDRTMLAETIGDQLRVSAITGCTA